MAETRPSKPTEKSESHWLELVRRQVSTLQFGVVQIIVHDRRVTQIERTERLRLDKPAPNYEI